MAKSTAAQTATPSEESIGLAARAIAGITGCGIQSARQRASQLPPKSLTQIAELEQTGKRNKIPGVLSLIPSSPKSK